MKAEKVMFVNARGFKEYAVRYKAHPFAKWQWVRDEKGNNQLTNFAIADGIVGKLTEDKRVTEAAAAVREGTKEE